MKKEMSRKLNRIVFSVLLVMLIFIAYFGISQCVRINRQNYSYIRAMSAEEAVAVNNAIDYALKAIQGFAAVKGEGLSVADYTEYIPVDRCFYIAADSNLAREYSGLDIVKLGLQGKTGVEIDGRGIVGEDVSLLLYAPVIQDGHAIGVLVGQLCQDSMAELLRTDCYGTAAVSFLTTSSGDIVFSAAGYEQYIGTNLFTDYFKDQKLISTSLDGLSSKDETFENLRNVMYNGGDFGFTCDNNGSKEISRVVSLDRGGFAILETFPGNVSAEMTGEQIRHSLLEGILLTVFIIFFARPLVRKFGEYRETQLEASRAEADADFDEHTGGEVQ